MVPDLPPAERPATDGRHLRRGRNRDAVVRSLLALYNEGNLNPSTDEIAARSGVSARSVFRYFDDVDDLCNAAINQQQVDVAHLLPVRAEPADPLPTKAAALAQQRCDLFEAIESVGMAMRLRAPFQLLVAERLTGNREYLREQVASLFAHELAAMPARISAARLAAADVVASFEGWRLLRDDQRLTRAKAREAVAESLVALFSTNPDGGGR